MSHRMHAAPSRGGWQVATAALVVPIALACHANAAVGPRPLGAGSVSVLIIDPHAGDTLYAGGGCGGVLKSTDGGGTWIVANTGLPESSYVGVLAIDPSTPSTLYAGMYGGVFKSTDSGGTWRAANTGLTYPTVYAVAIDPVTPSTLYAGTGYGGVFKSTNSGGTWSKTGRSGYYVDALAINPTTPSTLYAATYNDGVFKSTNSGASWSAAGPTDRVRALAIDPALPSTLYAGTASGVFKSTDSGDTWRAVSTDILYPDGLAIDPAPPGTLYARTYDGGVFKVLKSADGGDSWGASNFPGLPLFDPLAPSTRYATTVNGIFKSTDAGTNWGATGLSGLAICGDGLRCGREECDDGNLVDGDGCDSNCTLPRCGNGILDASEVCDDGNLVNGDGCDSNCTLPRCGNGILDAGEECDDSNLVDGDGCDSNCTLTGCGNGVVTADEECDDGNRNPYDGCTNTCTLCGNGIVTPPEECDDGNTNPADGCTTACTICGNGIVTVPEGCDDGNLVDDDRCAASCIVPNVCGNAVRDAGEECDDGGLCIGGANAGIFCTADTQCPGGACTTFGGDGCAANCTTESEVPLNLVPGVVDGLGIAPGTSGQVIHSDFISIGLPITGSETLTIGKERDGHIPVVIKAAAVHLARMPVATISCLCPRAVAAKTCGGTMFEPDGVTPSPDCTAGFTAGDSVCASKPPCTFVHGPGNSAAGVIGCDGLDGVNVSLTQDSGGASGIAKPLLVTTSGTGAAGSSVLFAHTAINGLLICCNDFDCGFCGGSCTGQDASIYGPDGEFCTDDDPQSVRGSLSGGLMTTGTASAAVFNTNGNDDETLGTFAATGHRFTCSLLADGNASGAALASVTLTVHEDTVGDSVTTNLLTTVPPPACVGDCHGDGQVTIDELLTLVNIALGTAQSPACPDGVPSGAGVNVALIIQAVNHALNGCGG